MGYINEAANLLEPQYRKNEWGRGWGWWRNVQEESIIGTIFPGFPNTIEPEIELKQFQSVTSLLSLCRHSLMKCPSLVDYVRDQGAGHVPVQAVKGRGKHHSKYLLIDLRVHVEVKGQLVDISVWQQLKDPLHGLARTHGAAPSCSLRSFFSLLWTPGQWSDQWGHLPRWTMRNSIDSGHNALGRGPSVNMIGDNSPPCYDWWPFCRS